MSGHLGLPMFWALHLRMEVSIKILRGLAFTPLTSKCLKL